MWNVVLPAAMAGAGLGAGLWQLRRRAAHRWLWPYLLQTGKRRSPRRGEPVHLLLGVADHYEPKLGGAPPAVARRRWIVSYRWSD